MDDKKVLSESPSYGGLRDIVAVNLGVTLDMFEKDLNKALTDQQQAQLNALRLLFPTPDSDLGSATQKAKYKALAWFRTHRVGRSLRTYVLSAISATREQYELNPANETTRLHLVYYKKLYDILYVIDIEGLI